MVHLRRVGCLISPRPALSPGEVWVCQLLINKRKETLGASQVAQWKRICLPMQETQVPSLGWEDPLEEEMATHSSILAWITLWTEEPGGIQPTRSQRVRHDLATK